MGVGQVAVGQVAVGLMAVGQVTRIPESVDSISVVLFGFYRLAPKYLIPTYLYYNILILCFCVFDRL